ncbi:MAG TPA: hypothetical protein VFX15_04765 [Actinomycetes bacterium]|nr:hypothetical protein [Actinomycetes bacterium]
MERCVGCLAQSKRHPIVAIAGKGDIDGDRVAENDAHAAHPVCERCWRVPTSRKQTLKAHFFDRNDMEAALEMAGSESIG